MISSAPYRESPMVTSASSARASISSGYFTHSVSSFFISARRNARSLRSPAVSRTGSGSRTASRASIYRRSRSVTLSLRLTASRRKSAARSPSVGRARPPRSEALLDCDLIVVHVRPETMGSPWLDAATIPTTRPVIFLGSRDHLLTLDPAVQGLACEFLMDPWQPDEALVRMSLALSKERAGAPRDALAGAVTGKIRVSADRENA